MECFIGVAGSARYRRGNVPGLPQADARRTRTNRGHPMKAYDYFLIAAIIAWCAAVVDAAPPQGDGTIPLRIASLETDVAEIKSGLATLLAKFEEQGHTPTKSILKAPRRHQAAPKKKTSHHRPSTTCSPPVAPMTTCAPKVYYRVVCPPMPMTTCGPKYYPMTTCSPRRYR